MLPVQPQNAAFIAATLLSDLAAANFRYDAWPTYN